MASLQSGIALAEGENLVMEIEAELWAESSNPIARILGAVKKIFAMVCGFRQKGFLVITNKRVVEVRMRVACYCIPIGREVKYVLPASVQEIGYTRKATFGCFCPAYNLYYASTTNRTYVLLKGANEQGALKAANAFYAATAQANTAV